MAGHSTLFDRLLQHRARAVAWPADLESVFAHLARQVHPVWLDSAGGPEGRARWSVLAAAPSAVQAQFEIGQAELKRGNWAGYGNAMREVEQLLSELGKAAAKTREER